MVKSLFFTKAQISQRTTFFVKVKIICLNHATFTRCNLFICIKTKCTDVAKRSTVFILYFKPITSAASSIRKILCFLHILKSYPCHLKMSKYE